MLSNLLPDESCDESCMSRPSLGGRIIAFLQGSRLEEGRKERGELYARGPHICLEGFLSPPLKSTAFFRVLPPPSSLHYDEEAEAFCGSNPLAIACAASMSSDQSPFASLQSEREREGGNVSVVLVKLSSQG